MKSNKQADHRKHEKSVEKLNISKILMFMGNTSSMPKAKTLILFT